MKIEYLRMNAVVWCPAGDSLPSSSKITYDHDHWNDNVNDSGAPRAREAGASEAP